MKKFLSVIGALFLFLIVVGLGLFIFVAHVGGDNDKESQSYVDAAVPQIFTNWSVDALYQYIDIQKAEKSGVTRDKITQLFSDFKGKLGLFKIYQGSKGTSLIGYFNGKRSVSAKYIASVEFQKSKADIQITLSKDTGEWKITGFYIQMPYPATTGKDK